jgi:hypothetical protein
MHVVREDTLRDVGQVRMINIAAFEQPDEGFMVRILDPVAAAGAGSDWTMADPDRI